MEMAARMKAAKVLLILFVCYYHFTFYFMGVVALAPSKCRDRQTRSN